jgi:hypothetical protein
MPDFAKLKSIRNLRPASAAEPPDCAVCGASNAAKLGDGTFADGQEAWYVPICEDCAETLSKPPEAPAIPAEGS